MVDANIELDVLVEKVINWHTRRYPELQSNSPSIQSLESIRMLCDRVLLPVQNQFGLVQVTYGFTSANLLNLIRKKNPSGIAPKLDQHAAHEVNSNDTLHCARLGASCDIIIPTHNKKMDEVANWISVNLPFDRLYFYGKNNPIHISVGPDNSRFIQIMKTAVSGKRIPFKNGVNLPLSRIWGG